MRGSNGLLTSPRQPSGSGSYYYSSAPPSNAHSSSTRSLNHSLPPQTTPQPLPPQPLHHSVSAAASPSSQPQTQTYRTVTTTKLESPRRSGTLPNARRSGSMPPPIDMEPPSYFVEHLASFAVGKEFGLQTPQDGVRKLKQMEKNSAIFAQPLILKLLPDRISVEEENNDIVEQFPMDLVVEPTAHVSNDPMEKFNNVLLFVVKEDRNGRRSLIPTEMHIFQCFRVAAQEVADDIHQYTRRSYHKVRPGRRGAPAGFGPPPPAPQSFYNGSTAAPERMSRRDGHREEPNGLIEGSGSFEFEVNTLNRCFDDIENFVARIQSAAIAQRELEIHTHRMRSKSARKQQDPALHAQHGILQMRSQLPAYNEFFDIFQKFKLCFNLLAKLKHHIHDPNAPELLHFLFTPLSVVYDACNWGLGRNVAEQVVGPLLTFDACELLRNCLSTKEMDLWMALGKPWRTPPEDWTGPPPPPYRPQFHSAFGAPPYFGGPTYDPPPPQQRYGSMPPPSAMHRGSSAPPPQRYAPPTPRTPYREPSFENLDFEKVNFEREKLEFEKQKVREREARLQEDERRLRQEQSRLEAERRLLHREAEKQSIAGSDRPDYYGPRDYGSAHVSPRVDRRSGSVQGMSNGHSGAERPIQPSAIVYTGGSPRSATGNGAGPSPRLGHQSATLERPPRLSPLIPLAEQSPQQRAYFEELQQRAVKAAQVTYDRVAHNPKELTVTKGEFLEVLSDKKNWWECRNAQQRSGFVPHTILQVIEPQDSHSSPRAASAQAAADYSTYADAIQSVRLRHVDSEPSMFDDDDDEDLDAEYDDDRTSRILSKLIKKDQKYVPEMVDTIKRKRQLIGPRRITSIRGPPITSNSSIENIQHWLSVKGFSEYVQQVLSKCNGEAMFRITADQFNQYCGAEGNRLYSLVTVQKRRANYNSGREAQLKALLQMRKQHVDEHNDADDVEPEFLAPQSNGVQKTEDKTEEQPKTPDLKPLGHRIRPLDPDEDLKPPVPIIVRHPHHKENIPIAPPPPAQQKQTEISKSKQFPTVKSYATAAPNIVKIQVLPRARLPTATRIESQPTERPPSQSSTIRQTATKTTVEIPETSNSKAAASSPPRYDAGYDSDYTDHSPRTQTLRTIAHTVRTYH